MRLSKTIRIRSDVPDFASRLAHAAVPSLCVLIFTMLLMALSPTAQADELRPSVNVDATTQLDVMLGHDGKPVPGMRFDLFRIGSMTPDGNVHVETGLSDILPDETLASSHIPASVISRIAERCSSSSDPLVSGTTDAHGNLTFGDDETLPVALYVVVGHDVIVDGDTYATLPFLVWLPQWDEKVGQWLYWVIASPKPEVISGSETDSPEPGEPSSPATPPDAMPSRKGVLDRIGDLLQTGAGIPVLAGIALLVTTVAEAIVARAKRRAEG